MGQIKKCLKAMSCTIKGDYRVKKEIEPCPFCGGEAEADVRFGAAIVECTTEGCGIGMIDMDNPFCDEVVKKWNTRKEKLSAKHE